MQDRPLLARCTADADRSLAVARRAEQNALDVLPVPNVQTPSEEMGSMMVMPSNQTGIEVGLLAGRYPGRIGHLFSPGGQRGPWVELPYALDNGAWPAFKNGTEWSESEWRHLMLWAAMSGIRPLWAVVPDVVGNREATIDRWHRYEPIVTSHGFRCAFAAQDGMTTDDVPDDQCVVFLGGSTEWKLSVIDPWCARFPGRVHVARVNTWDRLVKCWRAGAVSVDGTGWFYKGRSQVSSQTNDLRRFLKETNSVTRAA